MRQIRPERTIGTGLTHGMTVHTGGGLEQVTAHLHGRIVYWWLLLDCYPALEVIAGVHNDAQQHIGVLCPTVLGALAQIEAWLTGLNPHRVVAIGDEIRLARLGWDPADMSDICCLSGLV